MSTPYDDEPSLDSEAAGGLAPPAANRSPSMSPDAARIRALNDAFRRDPGSFAVLSGHDRHIVTRGVVARGDAFVARAVRAVLDFADFNDANDPQGEHDFGRFTLDDATLFWKIDYFDNQLEYGSPNPADPDVTRRVLTIMLADEY